MASDMTNSNKNRSGSGYSILHPAFRDLYDLLSARDRARITGMLQRQDLAGDDNQSETLQRYFFEHEHLGARSIATLFVDSFWRYMVRESGWYFDSPYGVSGLVFDEQLPHVDPGEMFSMSVYRMTHESQEFEVVMLEHNESGPMFLMREWQTPSPASEGVLGNTNEFEEWAGLPFRSGEYTSTEIVTIVVSAMD